ncbi:putative N-acetyltransferase domain-containing protein [Seiridium cardinale]
MGSPPTWIVGPMTKAVLADIFSSDQDMYPAPLTYARLQSWADACPDLSQCFYQSDPAVLGEETVSGLIAGAIIALPLKEKAWRDLLVGAVRETDVDASTMFAPDDGVAHAVGLHVFHVERFGDHVRGFTNTSLTYVRKIAEAKGWNVLGCSALTATSEGAYSFRKLDFQATGYEETWIERGGEVLLVPTYPEMRANASATELGTGSIKGQARMVAKFMNSGQGRSD